jgi:uroporphyrin-3 C-methyltransferase
MSDHSPLQLPAKPALPDEAPRKRAHSYSRLTTAIAVLALATAAYSLWRLDATRERLEQVNDLARTLAADRNALEGELRALAERERRSERDLLERLGTLEPLPKQVADLSAAIDELHGRTEGPQRAWSRAEALFLMEIAQRSLVLDRDVATAITALETADSRLASLRDPSLTAVRQQIASDLQALRTARVPDRTGLMTRLSAAEAEVARLPIAGLLAVDDGSDSDTELPQGWFARARAILGRALASFLRVRDIDDRGGTVVTLNEQLVRRQHLQLLLLSARTAVARHDAEAYRSALAAARQWLAEFFDMESPSTQALLKDIQLLEAVDIDPRLPDISKSAQSLQRSMPRSAQ